MTDGRFSRTELLLGSAAMEKLKTSRVAVFGLGGVGGFAAEALARSGVGALELVDKDTVALSNLNRQIIATEATVGRAKADALSERLALIAPDCEIRARRLFFTPESSGEFDFSAYDYVIDAIDTVTGKLELAIRAKETGTPIISSMGAGNKLDPTAFRVADISETKVCPLARIMRKELKKRGVYSLKVVYSEEPPMEPAAPAGEEPDEGRRSIPGSVSFVPSVAGLIIAGEVIKDLSGVRNLYLDESGKKRG